MCDMRSAMADARRRKRGLSPFQKGDSPLFLGVLLLIAVLVLSGCQNTPRPSPHAKMRAGDFAGARDLVEAQVVNDRSDRRYMLDRMRAGVLNLDAGEPERAERWFAEVYDVLRTQGLNEDKTVSAVVFTEGVKVWKGEPFEQAMALVYYGFVQASLGSWDNARAAAGNALFYLRDFSGEDDAGGSTPGSSGGRRIDTAEIARRAAAYEAQQRGESGESEGDPEYASGDDYLDHGYVAERNNFTMAYLLHGIASQQLGRDDEASDYYNRVLTLSPQMQPLVQQLRAGAYNTIVVVADGLGPRKVATGPSGALSRYQPLDRDRSPARLLYAGGPAVELPAVTDVNSMALDHRWNNLEDVRIAKSVLGDLAIAGGLGAVVIGADRDSEAAMIAGGAAVLAGLYLKATAKANTDHCDVFPQRLFVAALNVTEPGHELALELPGRPVAYAATLKNLAPPISPEAAFYYLRAPAERDLDPNPNPLTQPEGSLP